MYRASLARQQGIVVAGCKSSSLEIRRISLLKATGSALKIEMIFEGGQKVLQKRLKTLANTGEIDFYFIARILAGFLLILQPGINYPPMFIGWWKVESTM